MHFTFKTLLLAGALVCSLSGAQASITVLNTPGTEASPFSVGGVSGIKYSTSTSQLADQIAFGNNSDFNRQDTSHIGLDIYSIFKLSKPLYLSSATDDGTTFINATETGSGKKFGTFTSSVAYQYLAVHFGNNELVFDFSSTGGIAANKIFSIGGTRTGTGNLPNELSNWRAYTPTFTGTPSIAGITSPVPVPAALWLFSTALAGFGVMARRKSIKTT